MPRQQFYLSFRQPKQINALDSAQVNPEIRRSEEMGQRDGPQGPGPFLGGIGLELGEGQALAPQPAQQQAPELGEGGEVGAVEVEGPLAIGFVLLVFTGVCGFLLVEVLLVLDWWFTGGCYWFQRRCWS